MDGYFCFLCFCSKFGFSKQIFQMAKLFISIFVTLFLGTCLLNAQDVKGQEISLIPYPMTFVAGEGGFLFTDKTMVTLEDEELLPVVERFVQLFSKPAGFVPKVKLNSKKGNVRIRKDKTIHKEGYVLDVNPEKITIKVSSEEGLFYAFQTLRQLLPSQIESELECKKIDWVVPSVHVADEPRFGYRGLMVDVARYFISKEHLLRIIDCMGMLKLNKLHLHLTDNNGWRLEIKKYPLLTEIGSKKVSRTGLSFPERRNARQGEPLMNGGFYTQEDIKEIVTFAAERQIEVIPEISIPGHSNAALAAYPMLACPVIDKYIGVVPGIGGDHIRFAYCVGNDDTFTFLEHVIDEVIELFPSQYIHLGGDAIHNTYWEECPLCCQRLREERLEDEEDLLGYFMRRMDSYVRSKGKTVMGWEEVMEAHLSKGAVIFDWHGFGHGALKAGKQGHRFVMAPTGTMYLNTYQGPQWHERVLSFGGINTLKDIYHYEPVERYWTMSMRSNLLGVQTSLWTEFCETPEDVDYLLFPRLAAVSESVWSSPIMKTWGRFLKALDNYQQRWKMKGITPSLSMYNVQHEVVPSFGNLKVSLSCIRTDIEIRYTTDGTLPQGYSTLYRKPLVIKKDVDVKCATFMNGKQMGETLIIPIRKNEVTGKNVLRSNPVERRVVNGVRGSLKSMDGEWASWTKNDSIVLVFDMGSRKKMKRISLGFLNNFGLAIHKPKHIDISCSDNEMLYWKIVEKQFDEDEIFKEGCFVEDLVFEIDDTARYVRLVMKGAGTCPQWHVRPELEAQIYMDEMLVE